MLHLGSQLSTHSIRVRLTPGSRGLLLGELVALCPPLPHRGFVLLRAPSGRGTGTFALEAVPRTRFVTGWVPLRWLRKANGTRHTLNGINLETQNHAGGIVQRVVQDVDRLAMAWCQQQNTSTVPLCPHQKRKATPELRGAMLI